MTGEKVVMCDKEVGLIFQLPQVVRWCCACCFYFILNLSTQMCNHFVACAIASNIIWMYLCTPCIFLMVVELMLATLFALFGPFP